MSPVVFVLCLSSLLLSGTPSFAIVRAQQPPPSQQATTLLFCSDARYTHVVNESHQNILVVVSMFCVQSSFVPQIVFAAPSGRGGSSPLLLENITITIQTLESAPSPNPVTIGPLVTTDTTAAIAAQTGGRPLVPITELRDVRIRFVGGRWTTCARDIGGGVASSSTVALVSLGAASVGAPVLKVTNVTILIASSLVEGTGLATPPFAAFVNDAQRCNGLMVENAAILALANVQLKHFSFRLQDAERILVTSKEFAAVVMLNRHPTVSAQRIELLGDERNARNTSSFAFVSNRNVTLVANKRVAMLDDADGAAVGFRLYENSIFMVLVETCRFFLLTDGNISGIRSPAFWANGSTIDVNVTGVQVMLTHDGTTNVQTDTSSRLITATQPSGQYTNNILSFRVTDLQVSMRRIWDANAFLIALQMDSAEYTPPSPTEEDPTPLPPPSSSEVPAVRINVALTRVNVTDEQDLDQFSGTAVEAERLLPTTRVGGFVRFRGSRDSTAVNVWLSLSLADCRRSSILIPSRRSSGAVVTAGQRAEVISLSSIKWTRSTVHFRSFDVEVAAGTVTALAIEGARLRNVAVLFMSSAAARNDEGGWFIQPPPQPQRCYVPDTAFETAVPPSSLTLPSLVCRDEPQPMDSGNGDDSVFMLRVAYFRKVASAFFFGLDNSSLEAGTRLAFVNASLSHSPTVILERVDFARLFNSSLTDSSMALQDMLSTNGSARIRRTLVFLREVSFISSTLLVRGIRYDVRGWSVAPVVSALATDSLLRLESAGMLRLGFVNSTVHVEDLVMVQAAESHVFSVIDIIGPISGSTFHLRRIVVQNCLETSASSVITLNTYGNPTMEAPFTQLDTAICPVPSSSASTARGFLNDVVFDLQRLWVLNRANVTTNAAVAIIASVPDACVTVRKTAVSNNVSLLVANASVYTSSQLLTSQVEPVHSVVNVSGTFTAFHFVAYGRSSSFTIRASNAALFLGVDAKLSGGSLVWLDSCAVSLEATGRTSTVMLMELAVNVAAPPADASYPPSPLLVPAAGPGGTLPDELESYLAASAGAWQLAIPGRTESTNPPPFREAAGAGVTILMGVSRCNVAITTMAVGNVATHNWLIRAGGVLPFYQPVSLLAKSAAAVLPIGIVVIQSAVQFRGPNRYMGVMRFQPANRGRRGLRIVFVDVAVRTSPDVVSIFAIWFDGSILEHSRLHWHNVSVDIPSATGFVGVIYISVTFTTQIDVHVNASRFVIRASTRSFPPPSLIAFRNGTLKEFLVNLVNINFDVEAVNDASFIHLGCFTSSDVTVSLVGDETRISVVSNASSATLIGSEASGGTQRLINVSVKMACVPSSSWKQIRRSVQAADDHGPSRIERVPPPHVHLRAKRAVAIDLTATHAIRDVVVVLIPFLHGDSLTDALDTPDATARDATSSPPWPEGALFSPSLSIVGTSMAMVIRTESCYQRFFSVKLSDIAINVTSDTGVAGLMTWERPSNSHGGCSESGPSDVLQSALILDGTWLNIVSMNAQAYVTCINERIHADIVELVVQRGSNVWMRSLGSIPLTSGAAAPRPATSLAVVHGGSIGRRLVVYVSFSTIHASSMFRERRGCIVALSNTSSLIDHATNIEDSVIVAFGMFSVATICLGYEEPFPGLMLQRMQSEGAMDDEKVLFRDRPFEFFKASNVSAAVRRSTLHLASILQGSFFFFGVAQLADTRYLSIVVADSDLRVGSLSDVCCKYRSSTIIVTALLMRIDNYNGLAGGTNIEIIRSAFHVGYHPGASGRSNSAGHALRCQDDLPPGLRTDNDDEGAAVWNQVCVTDPAAVGILFKPTGARVFVPVVPLVLAAAVDVTPTSQSRDFSKGLYIVFNFNRVTFVTRAPRVDDESIDVSGVALDAGVTLGAIAGIFAVKPQDFTPCYSSVPETWLRLSNSEFVSLQLKGAAQPNTGQQPSSSRPLAWLFGTGWFRLSLFVHNVEGSSVPQQNIFADTADPFFPALIPLIGGHPRFARTPCSVAVQLHAVKVVNLVNLATLQTGGYVTVNLSDSTLRRAIPSPRAQDGDTALLNGGPIWLRPEDYYPTQSETSNLDKYSVIALRTTISGYETLGFSVSDKDGNDVASKVLCLLVCGSWNGQHVASYANQPRPCATPFPPQLLRDAFAIENRFRKPNSVLFLSRRAVSYCSGTISPTYSISSSTNISASTTNSWSSSRSRMSRSHPSPSASISPSTSAISTRSASATHSQLSTASTLMSRTKSASASPSMLRQSERPAPVFSQSIVSVASSSVAVAGAASVSAGASLAVARLAALSSVSSCSENPVYDDELPWTDSPLGLKVGGGTSSAYVGALVGNTLAVAVCCVAQLTVALAAMWFTSCWSPPQPRPEEESPSPDRFGAIIGDAAGMAGRLKAFGSFARFPSMQCFVLSLWQTPTFTVFTVVLIAERSTPLALLKGVLGIVWILFTVAVGMLILRPVSKGLVIYHRRRDSSMQTPRSSRAARREDDDDDVPSEIPPTGGTAVWLYHVRSAASRAVTCSCLRQVCGRMPLRRLTVRCGLASLPFNAR